MKGGEANEVSLLSPLRSGGGAKRSLLSSPRFGPKMNPIMQNRERGWTNLGCIPKICMQRHGLLFYLFVYPLTG